MNRILPIIALFGLVGCSAVNPAATNALTTAGDANAATHVADANALGQLACQLATGGWVQVTGANVVGATAAAVANVCAAASPGAVPGAVPDDQVAKVVSVGNDVLAMLAASKAVGLL